MPISQSDLLEASKATVVAKADNLVEARRMGLKSAFLCHSHIDSKLAAGLSNMLRREGWNIYIDWQDASMPSKPNRTTALKIKAK